jgi:hypothetical protein
MARANKNFVGVFVSFLVILVLIAVVHSVLPGALDGFQDMACYGVSCKEGEFCQNSVCRPINPAYTNDYYNKGVEGFLDKKKTNMAIGLGVGGAVVLLGVGLYMMRSTPTSTV